VTSFCWDTAILSASSRAWVLPARGFRRHDVDGALMVPDHQLHEQLVEVRAGAGRHGVHLRLGDLPRTVAAVEARILGLLAP
jgi:hypothetical protein